ncbi:MAG: hydroxymethylglutaryl-CoA reductase [Cytophagia bacterium]|nr:MAG: hydroxymethylglutaryl-CoA reductase [Cytophagales bacterium]TAG03581.1 MAG: hydroxymethylglutaryl-CoA reductase [Cytophagia bacterium]TAG46247.1 MAG: hydroxymethylglutaryl-CoA reductase [Cytophagia bacterium]TAH30475.1 MAG: hydroxymethylglutaryl-CoA reductase [Cytophagales bacterium]
MTVIPSLLLKQLYTNSSLKNNEDGTISFELKNRLSDAKLLKINTISINGNAIPLTDIHLELSDGTKIAAQQIDEASTVSFSLKQMIKIVLKHEKLIEGKHSMGININADPFGKLEFVVEDSIETKVERIKIPRNDNDDYSEEAIKDRHKFVESFTGVKLEHINQYSFDPHTTAGNCEHFIGVAQVPLGIAGPLLVNGEHAKGEFLIPMATAEGTLVASYNRGISVLNLSGGAKCTIIGDAMQRAPVFVFEDARGAREFNKWVQANFKLIAAQAETTSRIAKLIEIDTYLSNKFAFMRFNYTTGDAAGQNMVGRATFAACSWILDNYKDYKIEHFYLESNFATDKKASQVNIMRTRGKRVVAECVIKRNVLIERMRVEPEQLIYHAGVANVGAILSGANNNGAHSANGITALFIATGQDVANVSESSAGVLYSELTPEKDLYLSITIPSLIVATHGGGVGLATQNESLKMLGCVNRGDVNKFAEIVAGVVLAGEISLASAISSSDWVSSHEKYGRNR